MTPYEKAKLIDSRYRKSGRFKPIFPAISSFPNPKKEEAYIERRLAEEKEKEEQWDIKS